jgi:intracellular sulfur oxidation DsrE/DsrF family protein
MIASSRKYVTMTRVVASLLCIACMAASLHAQTPNKVNQEKPTVLKAVIHINFKDPERHEHALNNVENILKEASDAELIVVCHGEGITLVSKKQTKHSDLVQSLIKKGVHFAACQNTMKKKSLSKEDLVDGTLTVPSGAVEVIRRQSDGYSYFKP